MQLICILALISFKVFTLCTGIDLLAILCYLLWGSRWLDTPRAAARICTFGQRLTFVDLAAHRSPREYAATRLFGSELCQALANTTKQMRPVTLFGGSGMKSRNSAASLPSDPVTIGQCLRAKVLPQTPPRKFEKRAC